MSKEMLKTRIKSLRNSNLRKGRLTVKQGLEYRMRKITQNAYPEIDAITAVPLADTEDDLRSQLAGTEEE